MLFLIERKLEVNKQINKLQVYLYLKVLTNRVEYPSHQGNSHTKYLYDNERDTQI